MSANVARGWIAALSALALFAASCAPVAQAPTTTSPPPASGAPPASGPATAPATRTASPSASRTDSLPSPEAERVLATIAEPLAASQRVPPDSSRRQTAVAPAAAHDTLRVQLQDGNPSAPVPAPTPVSTAPAVTFAPPESAAGAAPTTSSTPPPPSAAPAVGTGAAAPSTSPASGTCWRVQVAAPETREEAEAKLAAAQSLLVVKMAITPEKGRYKVRTAECMTRDVADTMKRRAQESGFDGAFLVDTSTPPKVSAPSSRSSGESRP